MKLCPKCGCLSCFNSYFSKWMCNTCEHMWREEPKVANHQMEAKVTDLETFKQIVVETHKLKLQLGKVLDAIDEGVPCPNVVDLPVTVKCSSANCKECWIQALDTVGVTEEHPDGPTCSPDSSETKQEIKNILHDMRNMPDGSTYSIALVREMLESLLEEEGRE